MTTPLEETQAKMVEQAQIIQRLKEELEHLHTFMLYNPAPAWITDDKGILRYLSHNYYKVFGVPEDAVGKSIYEVYPTEIADYFLKNIKAVVRSGQVISDVEPFPKPGTSLIGSALVYKFPLKSISGEILVGGIAIDISKQVDSEKALAESETRIRLMVQNLHDIIAIIEPTGIIRFVSQAVERLIGYAPAEMEGTLAFDGVHPEDLNRVVETFSRSLAQPSVPVLVEFRFRHKNNSWVDFELIGSGFLHLSEIKGIVVNMRDITEKKRAEKEAKKHEAEFKQRQKMEALGRLAGGISHDFNNLLTIILGYTELILQDSTNSYYQYMQEIKTAAESGATLTHQLLSFSRQQVTTPQILNINQVISKMESMLKRMVGEDVEFTTLLEPELGLVKADAGQIEQVLMNLVVNARAAMPNGGKLLIESKNVNPDQEHGRRHPSMRIGPHVLLTVSDTGVGMDEATKSQIFEPFFTTKEVGQGTGMGLATVYGIVEYSEGYIETHSQLGVGTTFKIYLPQVEAKETTVKQSAKPGELKGGDETILLVEDNESILKMTTRLLIQQGYKVLANNKPDQAIKICRTMGKEIDLIISDIVMLEMDGINFIKLVREYCPSSQIIFMSGYTDGLLKQKGLSDLKYDFVQKPFSAASLLTTIRRSLNKR